MGGICGPHRGRNGRHACSAWLSLTLYCTSLKAMMVHFRIWDPTRYVGGVNIHGEVREDIGETRCSTVLNKRAGYKMSSSTAEDRQKKDLLLSRVLPSTHHLHTYSTMPVVKITSMADFDSVVSLCASRDTETLLTFPCPGQRYTARHHRILGRLVCNMPDNVKTLRGLGRTKPGGAILQT